jgi:hypothetical protein
VRRLAVALVLCCAAVAWAQSGVTYTPNLSLSRQPNSATGILNNFDTLDAKVAPDTAVVTAAPYGAVADNTTDSTVAIQAAIDANVGVVYLPAGTYRACNLYLRGQPSQVLRGAGRGETTLRGTAGCANLLNANNSAILGGVLGVEDLTLSYATTTLLTVSGRDTFRVRVQNVGFDTCAQSASTGAIGIAAQGLTDLQVINNEFYSTCPGDGKGILYQRSVRGGLIAGNTFRWLYNGVELGNSEGTGSQVEGVKIVGNDFNFGWLYMPTKYTSSGGTVTYAATTLTDSAAAFSGLCQDAGSPGACTAPQGHDIRVLTVKATGTTSSTFDRGNNVLDAGDVDPGGGTTFATAGVKRLDMIRSVEKYCQGNGTLALSSRGSCSGAAGSGLWGDRCTCTQASDCSSALCRYRMTWVRGVGTTDLATDEWVDDGDGTLGAYTAGAATRRPVGPPPNGATYKVYAWIVGHIASYTGTVLTLDAQGWRDFYGTATTPTAGDLYEVMVSHPNYVLLGNANAVRTTFNENTVSLGWSDMVYLVGGDSIIANNTLRDGEDHCTNFQGARNIVTGNLTEHCGIRGIACVGCFDSIIANNVAIDQPWRNTAGYYGDIVIESAGTKAASRNLVIGNKAQRVSAMTLADYGIIVRGIASYAADQNVLDNNTCNGSYTTNCYRINDANATNVRITGYQGEGITNASGTYSISGPSTPGVAFAALGTPQNGSVVYCSDCTVASPCAGGGTGALAKRLNGAWVCN